MDVGFPKDTTRRQAKFDKEEKSTQALIMHLSNNSYREIGRALGVSHTTAHGLVKEELMEAAKLRNDLGPAALEVELKTIQDLIELCKRDMTKSIEVDFEEVDGQRKRTTTLVDKIDPQIGQLLIRAQERKAKFLGQDQAQKVEVNHHVTIEQLINASNQPELLEGEIVERKDPTPSQKKTTLETTKEGEKSD